MLSQLREDRSDDGLATPDHVETHPKTAGCCVTVSLAFALLIGILINEGPSWLSTSYTASPSPPLKGSIRTTRKPGPMTPAEVQEIVDERLPILCQTLKDEMNGNYFNEELSERMYTSFRFVEPHLHNVHDLVRWSNLTFDELDPTLTSTFLVKARHESFNFRKVMPLTQWAYAKKFECKMFTMMYAFRTSVPRGKTDPVSPFNISVANMTFYCADEYFKAWDMQTWETLESIAHEYVNLFISDALVPLFVKVFGPFKLR